LPLTQLVENKSFPFDKHFTSPEVELFLNLKPFRQLTETFKPGTMVDCLLTKVIFS